MRATPDERQAILRATEGRRTNRAGFVRVNCPVCPGRKGSDDTGQSFGFRPITGGFRCFRCGVNGRMSGDRFVLPDVADAVEDADAPKVDLGDLDDYFETWTDDGVETESLQPAIEFLNRRGITREHQTTADIRAAVSGRFAGRVIVPHKDEFGVWWGFTSRIIPPPPGVLVRNALLDVKPPPKVLYPSGMDRSRMYNEQALFDATDEPVMLVEGCLDAVWYLPACVAALGKPTGAHFVTLCTANRPVVVCLDGDAWEEGRALSYRLRLRGVRASFVRLPAGEDPNSVDPNWLRQAVAAAGEEACNNSNHSPSSPKPLVALER